MSKLTIRTSRALELSTSHNLCHFFMRLFMLGGLWFAPLTFVAAQNIQNPQSAVDNLMRSNLQVDPATGALQLQIPLGGPAGRGEADVPVVLRYSSKVWNIKFHALLPCSGEPVTEYQAEYAKSSRAGWTTSVGGAGGSPDVSLEIYDPLTQKPATRGNTIARKYVTLLDGSRHELRRDDAVHSPGEDLSGNYYAVDGSRIWMDTAGTLFMPDGSRYQNVNGQRQRIDRNGNYIAFVGGVWQDTLNRSIPLPIPSNSPTVGATPYTLPGGMTYTLIWKNLADVLTDTSQQLLNQGDANPGCVPGAGGTSLFHSTDGQQKILKVGIHDPVVLSQIVLPNNTSYTFTYNVWGEIDKIVYPTGGSEQFTYGIWPALGGQLDDGTYSQANRGIFTRTVSDGVTPPQTWNYDPAPLGMTGVDPASVPRSVIAPDGSKTVTWYYKSRGFDIKYGFDDARAGMPREERVYNSANTMLRRTLLQAVADGPQPGGFSTATRNARVTKKVDIVLETDGNALASATEFTYDSDLNVIKTNYYDYVSISKSIAENGDIPSILSGTLTLLRSDETDYLTNDQNYRARNLLSLPTATRVKDGLGNLVAQSSIGYDDATLLSEIPSTNWSNPGTNARGNPTTISQWVNVSGNQFTTWPAGRYVVTHAEYDQAGNLRKSTDAKGNQSQIEYSSTFANAYPTLTRSAVPDPSGAHGSLTALESMTDYDFNTGLIRSRTDANGQTTSIDYTDPLNRVKQVTQPNGAHVTYNYFDTPSDLYVSILTDSDTSRVIETRKYFDKLGRPTRTFAYDGTASTPWVVTDNYYDAMGRVSKISNPYRVSTPDSAVPVICSVCTTTTYDALGRVLTETTPDNAQVATSYGAVTSGPPLGPTTTVSDQALRKRRSLTDALGRLVRVDEPNPQTGDLDVGGTSTTYAYDVLGNLRKVTQGGQQRFFLYDSLSRLLRSHNPEQLAGSLASNLTDPITGHAQWSQAYGYDNNGNLTTRVDARNITTTYGYDALNRITSVAYSDGITPTVNRYYDSAINGRGRLHWDEAVGVSANVFDAYDALGRPTQYHQKFWTNGAWGQDFKITRSYDKAGHVLTQTYPSGHIVNYTYDSAGRVNSSAGNIGDGVTRTYSSAATYSVFGGLQEEQFGTQIALYHKLHYNVRGQLYDVRLSTYSMQANDLDWNRGAVVNYFSANYAFGGSGTDNNGNVLRQASFIPANDSLQNYNYTEDTFSYDFLNRLKSVSERPATQGGYGSPTITQMFDYDVYGNRTINQAGTTQLSGVNNRLATTVSTATNRLYAPGETDQSHSLIDYDAAGNQKKDYYSDSASGYSYDRTYDGENRMIGSTVTYSSGGSQLFNYFYDAGGLRIKRKTSTTETWQVYGLDGELLAEYQAAGAPFLPVTEYGYRGGELLTTISSGDASRLNRFVYNLYYGAKHRDPNAQELQDATNQLAAAGAVSQAQLLTTASKIARSLFTSTNYETTSSPARSNTEFVTDLYYTYLQRGPDDSGLNWWAVTVLPTSTRENVCNAFEASGEFQTLVSTLYGTSVSDNERTEHFVNDFYLGAYSRNATTAELQQQRDRLNTEAAKGQSNVQSQAETMGRALFAQQLNDSSISNNQYVTNLYEAFLQRGPDTGGLNFWSAQANVGQGRQNVLNAFATCPPFKELAGMLYREANWLVTDQLGTPRIVVNKSGALSGVKRHDYLPFGEELGANIGGRTIAQGYTGDSIRQKFTSKERDNETGLDYFEARYYGSSQGRFTSVDPILSSARKNHPQSWNRYNYVLNNPLVLVDPNGLQDQTEDLRRRLREQQQNQPITTTETTPATEIQLRPLTATAQDQAAIQQADLSMGLLTQTQLTNANQAVQDSLGMVAPLPGTAINPCREALITNFGAANPTTALQSVRTTGGAAVMGPDGITTGPQNVFNGTTTALTGVVDGSTTGISTFLAANPQVSAATVGGNIFLNSSFDRESRLERAQTMIHEAVVHVANGRSDRQFAPSSSTQPRVDGSHQINEIIRTNCNRLPR
jgi:RHS repeat-associated protein